MENIPTDISNYIFQLKHQLEMKDICADIKKVHNDKMERVMDLVIYRLNNPYYYLYNPECIAHILVALRNEGYMQTNMLQYFLDNIVNNIASYFNFYDSDMLILDVDYYIDDHCISLNDLIRTETHIRS